MWLLFLRSFNSELLWPRAPEPNSQLQLYTEAAGSSGFGAFFQGEWCVGRWPQAWLERDLCTNMLLLELFPIIVAVELWASCLADHSIVFWCDNLGVVQAINNQRGSSLQILRLLRYLVFRCLQFNINCAACARGGKWGGGFSLAF